VNDIIGRVIDKGIVNLNKYNFSEKHGIPLQKSLSQDFGKGLGVV